MMRLQPHHHQNGKWPKTTKRVSTAKKNNLNNDFCDQRTSTTNTDSMVLKIQLQYLKMRASVPIYEAQCVIFTAAIRTNNDNLRVAGQGLGNTRAVRTNNAYEYSHPWLVQERV